MSLCVFHMLCVWQWCLRHPHLCFTAATLFGWVRPDHGSVPVSQCSMQYARDCRSLRRDGAGMTINKHLFNWRDAINANVSVCWLCYAIVYWPSWHRISKLSLCMLCTDAATTVTDTRFRVDVFALFSGMTHLLPYGCPGWWTLWRPRAVSCCLGGILHVFRPDRTWKRGSIQPEISNRTNKT